MKVHVAIVAVCLCSVLGAVAGLNTCQFMTDNDLIQLSGWQKFQDTVARDLGGGWDGYVLNFSFEDLSSSFLSLSRACGVRI